MKYLILTAATGGGHIQAAKNLKNEIEKQGNTCIIYGLFNKSKFHIIEKGYDFLLNANLNKAYSILYKISDIDFINSFFLKNFLIHYELKLKKLLETEKPDVIISTHPFGVPMYAQLRRLFKFDIPYIQIITDFKAHATYIDKVVDAYIVGSDYTKETLVEKGIDQDKVFIFGIPVKEEFRTKKENISDDFNILLMGGSLGLKAMEKVVDILVNSNLPIHLTVVCGKNIKLQKKLTKTLTKQIIDGKVHIYGFTDKISDIMDNSKLIITKPGGLTSTEAINKHLPMIIPFYIPGQEEENTAFLVESNMALEIKDFEHIPNYINFLIENNEYYNNMVDSMKKLAKCYSTTKIIELANQLIKK